MNSGGIILAGGALAATIIIGLIIWQIIRTRSPSLRPRPAGPDERKDTDVAVEHIFDDAFREELRNRGRLHFEKVLGENATFLQQDLRQTTTQLNEYMKAEITRTLQEEFKNYEQSISDAKQLAIGSIEKTISAIEQQRQFLETQMQSQADNQKARLLEQFEKNMASVINHYVQRAIGDQIDLSDQLDYILAELESNKKEIAEDMKSGV